jgi:hypothetical protein
MEDNKPVDRIVRLDVHDSDNKLLERWKCRVSNRNIGMIILLRVKDLFDFSMSDLEEKTKSDLDEEKKMQEKLIKHKF